MGCIMTSDEVNYLIHRYLLESGFSHSSFAFQQESAIKRIEAKGSQVRPGALINLLQKGLQYIEVETHINEDGSEKQCNTPFSLLTPHECEYEEEREETRLAKRSRKESNSTISVQRLNKDGKENRKAAKPEKEPRKEKIRKDNISNVLPMDISDDPMIEVKEESKAEEIKIIETKESTDIKNSKLEKESKDIKESKDPNFNKKPSNGTTTNPKIYVEICDDIQVLTGHQNEVFNCSWNSVYPLIATGSSDGTARIWQVPEKCSEFIPDPVILLHGEKDVTSVEWNPSGEYLATGAYDGIARIWYKSGEIRLTMNKHKGPIFSLKWNKQVDLLLTSSADQTAIIWDLTTGESRQEFHFHTAPILDVDWRDNSTFASSSSDTNIHVCQLGSPEPLHTFSGHKNEVNSLKWDPSGTFLASGSDDTTAKVWSMETKSLLHDLTGHTKEIYTIRWCPVLVNSAEGKSQRLLATASFDKSVRIWDIHQGSCIFTLSEHNESVYSVSWSPNGMYIATGAFDTLVNVWSIKDQTLIKRYYSEGGVFEVNFNQKGDRMAISYADSKVAIIYFRDPVSI